MQVSQAAGGILQVRFQVVLGVIEALVAGDLFFPLGGEKCRGIPHVLRVGAHFKLLAKPVIAGQCPGLHDIGGHGDIVAGQIHTFIQRANRMADLQADIPEKCHESFQLPVDGIFGGICKQHQQVHIRAGVKFAAAVAAHGDQGRAGLFGQAKQGPGTDHHLIDELGPGVHQVSDI